MTGRATLAALVQGLLLALAYSYTASFCWFLLAVFVLQMVVAVLVFYSYWAYCWSGGRQCSQLF